MREKSVKVILKYTMAVKKNKLRKQLLEMEQRTKRPKILKNHAAA